MTCASRRIAVSYDQEANLIHIPFSLSSVSESAVLSFLLVLYSTLAGGNVETISFPSAGGFRSSCLFPFFAQEELRL